MPPGEGRGGFLAAIGMTRGEGRQIAGATGRGRPMTAPTWRTVCAATGEGRQIAGATDGGGRAGAASGEPGAGHDKAANRSPTGRCAVRTAAGCEDPLGRFEASPRRQSPGRSTDCHGPQAALAMTERRTGDATSGAFGAMPFHPGDLLSAGSPHEHRARVRAGMPDVTANIVGLAARKDGQRTGQGPVDGETPPPPLRAVPLPCEQGRFEGPERRATTRRVRVTATERRPGRLEKPPGYTEA